MAVAFLLMHFYLSSAGGPEHLMRYNQKLKQLVRATERNGDALEAYQISIPSPPMPPPTSTQIEEEDPRGPPQGQLEWNLVDANGNSLLTWRENAQHPDLTPKEIAEFPTRIGEGKIIKGKYIIGKIDDHHFLLYDSAPEEQRRLNGLYIVGAGVVGCVLLVCLALFLFLVWFLREKAKLAEGVLNKIQQGDIKARFPIERLDETGRLMRSFNAMADQVEMLISQIRQSEKSRVEKLQEIGHDLRTPIAGIRVLIDALKIHAEKLSPEKRRELLDQCAQETTYMADLTDNLLYLAIIETPNAIRLDSYLDPIPPLREVISAVNSKRPHVDFSLDILSPSEFPKLKSDLQILQRLFRNILENMSTFARSKISIVLKANRNGITLLFEDDGPGYPEEILENFGTRRFHTGKDQPQGRLSLGLGSIIIRSLVEAHQGSVSVENRSGEQGILGSRLSIYFPA